MEKTEILATRRLSTEQPRRSRNLALYDNVVLPITRTMEALFQALVNDRLSALRCIRAGKNKIGDAGKHHSSPSLAFVKGSCRQFLQILIQAMLGVSTWVLPAFGGSFESLGTFGGASHGNDISADGSSIVGDNYNSSYTEAFRRTGRQRHDWPGPSRRGNSDSVARVISADGSAIVGYSSNRPLQ